MRSREIATLLRQRPAPLALRPPAGDDTVPIPSTRSPECLAENAAAADIELTDEELARVNEILPDGSFGSRYPVAMMPKW
jgi:diketogulonate reductase-like aldo/keto reductase